MIRILRAVAVCTVGVVATAAAAAKASEETLFPRAWLPKSAESLKSSKPTRDFVATTRVDTTHTRVSNDGRREARLIEEAPATDTISIFDPESKDLVQREIALDLCQPHCETQRWKRFSTARQRDPPPALQEVSLQRQDLGPEGQQKRLRYPEEQRRAEPSSRGHQRETSLGKNVELHSSRHDGEFQVRTPHLLLSGRRKQENSGGQESVLQQAMRKQQSFNARRLHVEIKKLSSQGFEDGHHPQEAEATVQQEQQQPTETQHLHDTHLQQQQYDEEFPATQQIEKPQGSQQQREPVTNEKGHSQALSIANSLTNIHDLKGVSRALQHIVQRQVLDIGAAAEQHVRHDALSKTKRDPEGEQVQPVESARDSAPDVRGQEQKVLWGGEGAKAQLPQQISLSQVLIQNSSQLFFNYDKPQQRGGSKKSGNGDGVPGEYNWQQYDREQPGGSDGEQQQGEQEDRQEQLQRQQQQLLEEVLMWGRDVDKAHRQLRAYQRLRQQLQTLHFLQLQLMQQLKLLKKHEKQRLTHDHTNMRQHGSMNQHRQSVSLVQSNGAIEGRCVAENNPLYETFVQWLNLQKATDRLLSVNDDILVPGRKSAELPSPSSRQTSAMDSSVFQDTGSTLRHDPTAMPDVKTPVSPPINSSVYRVEPTQYTLNWLMSLFPMADRSRAFPGTARQDTGRIEGKEGFPHEKGNDEHNGITNMANHLPHPQLLVEQPLQQRTAEDLYREDDDKPVSSDNQNEEDKKTLDKEQQIDNPAHNSRLPLLSCNVHNPLFPACGYSVEQSATGLVVPSAPGENSFSLTSVLGEPVQRLIASSENGEYTRHHERKQQKTEQGNMSSVGTRTTGVSEESSYVQPDVLVQEYNGGKASGESESAVERHGDRQTNVATIGSANEDKDVPEQGNPRARRKKNPLTDAQPQQLTLLPLETASSQNIVSPRSRKDEAGQRVTNGVSAVNAQVGPDDRRRVREQPSTLDSRSEQERGILETANRTTAPGTHGSADGTTKTTSTIRSPSPRSTSRKRADERPANSLRFQGHKPAQGRRERQNKATTAPAWRGKESESSPEVTVRAVSADVAAAGQACEEELQYSLEEQKSPVGKEQSRRPVGETDPEEMRKRMQLLQQETQQYEVGLTAMIHRVEQQQEELERKKRALEQQKQELSQLRNTLGFEECEGHQQSVVDTAALLRGHSGEAKDRSKAERKVGNPHQRQSQRLSSRSKKDGGGYSERAAPDSELPTGLHSASPTRTLQLFGGSIFDPPRPSDSLALCRTAGQPCAAETLCCEDLECFVPVNNSYGATRPDGRGICQPANVAALPTSSFHLPVQLNPVLPQGEEREAGTTMLGGLLSGPRDLLNGDSLSQRDSGVSRIPGATTASGDEETRAGRIAALGVAEGSVGGENPMGGRDGTEGSRRAGFAGQFRLPSNSRTLREGNSDVEH